MILLQLHQVTRLFGAEALFHNVQLEVKDNSKIAIVGHNGAGKSTLLKIIAGVERPDEGQVIKTNNLSLAYLAQNTGLDSDKTIFEEMTTVYHEVIEIEKRMHQLEEQMSLEPHNDKIMQEYDKLQVIFSDANGYGYEAEIRSILHGFKFDESYFNRKINTLSGGQKTRLALAKTLLEKPDLLIMDEPTNHLDIETLDWLENYLKNYPKALIIVSHDRYFLDNVVNEIYELQHQTLHHYHGNYTKYIEQKAKNEEQYLKAYNKQQQEIEKMETFIAKNIARSSTTKRAQSRQKQLDKLQRLDKPSFQIDTLNPKFNVAKFSGNDVLQLDEVAIGYEQNPLAQNINFQVKRNEAIAIIGPNGIGKSTLLKTIIKQLPAIKGKITYGTNVTLGYYDQEQATLHSNKTVLSEIWDEHPLIPEKDIRTLLASFLFKGDDVTKPISVLSGGEKARLTLAKLALEKQNTLILDEPTNHLDLSSKEMLESALIDFEGTLIFVSHDRYFINQIATKIIELTPTGSKEYLGNYDYYLTKKAEEHAFLTKEETNMTLTPKNKTKQLSREEQKQQRQLKKQIDKLEEEMAVIEEQIASLNNEMFDEKYLNDSYQLNKLQTEIDQLNDQLTSKLTLWEELIEQTT